MAARKSLAIGRVRQQLDDVETDDLRAGSPPPEQPVDLIPVEATGLRGPGRRHHRRVEAVEVDRDVDLVPEERDDVDPSNLLDVRARDLVGPEDALRSSPAISRPSTRECPTWTIGHHSRARAITQAWLKRRSVVLLAGVGVGVDLEHRQPSGGSRAAARMAPIATECSPPRTTGQLAASQRPADRVVDEVGQLLRAVVHRERSGSSVAMPCRQARAGRTMS